jgi:hypothetical protein
MARRMTPAQFKSHVRQVQNRQRQAVDQYNRAVRDYNRKVNTAIDNYNREVRAHNARVRSNRQRLAQALSSLQRRTTVTRYVTFRASVETLHRSYVSLDRTSDSVHTTDFQNEVLDLSERENANSLEVMNALLADAVTSASAEGEDLSRLRETKIDEELRDISSDLDNRWRGALFSLHPANPDASRHFCTSAREIFTSILEHKAPDDLVKGAIPNCPLTHEGRPTRRARIHFALRQKGIVEAALQLEEFIDDDVENILELFGVFNDGTHGSSGRFEFGQLVAIKTRVEDGISFLHKIFT